MAASERVWGVLLTVAALVANTLLMGPAVMGVNLGLVVALVAWSTSRPDPDRVRRRVFPLYLASLGVQALHFVEEVLTSFYTEFPKLLGSTWEPARFVTFNLVWLAVFLLAAVGVRGNVHLALLAVWFMALIGGIGNGLLHCALALRAGGYFPGVVTAAVAFPLGVTLVVALSSRRSFDR